MATSNDPPPPPSATDPHIKWPTPKFIEQVERSLRVQTALLFLIFLLVAAMAYKVLFGGISVQTVNVGERVTITKQADVRQASFRTQ